MDDKNRSILFAIGLEVIANLIVWLIAEFRILSKIEILPLTDNLILKGTIYTIFFTFIICLIFIALNYSMFRKETSGDKDVKPLIRSGIGLIIAGFGLIFVFHYLESEWRTIRIVFWSRFIAEQLIPIVYGIVHAVFFNSLI
ncbi:hypothetical protein KA005_57205, partial [bacterium]|nr:hypothetical protein [bacterium]